MPHGENIVPSIKLNGICDSIRTYDLCVGPRLKSLRYRTTFSYKPPQDGASYHLVRLLVTLWGPKWGLCWRQPPLDGLCGTVTPNSKDQRDLQGFFLTKNPLNETIIVQREIHKWINGNVKMAHRYCDHTTAQKSPFIHVINWNKCTIIRDSFWALFENVWTLLLHY